MFIFLILIKKKNFHRFKKKKNTFLNVFFYKKRRKKEESIPPVNFDNVHTRRNNSLLPTIKSNILSILLLIDQEIKISPSISFPYLELDEAAATASLEPGYARFTCRMQPRPVDSAPDVFQLRVTKVEATVIGNIWMCSD